MRAPKAIASEGCGFCVRISEQWLAEALRQLQENGLAAKQIFMQMNDGGYNEVQP